MASVMVRRRFGTIRKLPSGRYQASFKTPDGKRESAPETYRTAADGARYLDRIQQEIERGHWLPDARLGRRTLREYCESYLEENPRVGERWAETCHRNMRLHLDELLDLPVVAIAPPVVRPLAREGTAVDPNLLGDVGPVLARALPVPEADLVGR